MGFSPRVIIEKALFALGEAIFPRRCGHCDMFIEEPDWLCLACRKMLDELSAKAFCDRCAAPLAMEGAPCPFCQGKGLFPLGYLARLAVYDEPLRKLIHRLKYDKRHMLADKLADDLAQVPKVIECLVECDLVIPIPLHWKRHYSRGFNQSDLLGVALGKRFGRKTLGALKRIRDTPTQTRMTSQADRHENVKGAFTLAVKPRRLEGKKIVLVDDVMTTGATLREAARVLMRAKPHHISAVFLSAADPKNRDFTRL